MTPHSLVASPRALTRFRSASRHRLALPAEAPYEPAAEPVAPARACALCRESPATLWHGQGWQLSLAGPTGLPFAARLAPVRHLRQTEIEDGLLVGLEPILRTIKAVLTAEPEISEIEVMDSGPHATHFALMVMARPGDVDGRLGLLAEMLPEVDPAIIRDRGLRVSAALPQPDFIAI